MMILQVTDSAKKSIEKYSKRDGKTGALIAKFLCKVRSSTEEELKPLMKPCLSPLAPFYHKHLAVNLIIMVLFQGGTCVVTGIGSWEMFFGSRKKQ